MLNTIATENHTVYGKHKCWTLIGDDFDGHSSDTMSITNLSVISKDYKMMIKVIPKNGDSPKIFSLKMNEEMFLAGVKPKEIYGQFEKGRGEMSVQIKYLSL